ncbi:MAG: TetR/AcrR family transcriptional regulator [Chloroflexota bacterium]
MIRAGKTKWDDKRDASYNALVRSAMHSFQIKGYAATTVADIVAGTGYTAGAFYHLFTNKADCFWHVIASRERLRGDWSKLAQEVDPSTTPLEQLLERVFGHFATSPDGLTEWVLVMVDFHQQHRDDTEAMAKLAGTYVRWRDEAARFVEAPRANGWIATQTDSQLVAQEVFAYAEGTIVHTTLYGGAENAARARRALLDGLVKLLRN